MKQGLLKVRGTPAVHLRRSPTGCTVAYECCWGRTGAFWDRESQFIPAMLGSGGEQPREETVRAASHRCAQCRLPAARLRGLPWQANLRLGPSSRAQRGSFCNPLIRRKPAHVLLSQQSHERSMLTCCDLAVLQLFGNVQRRIDYHQALSSSLLAPPRARNRDALASIEMDADTPNIFT